VTDEESFAAFGVELADAVERALPGWVRRSVNRFLAVDPNRDPTLDRKITEAGSAAADDVGPRLRELLALELEYQWTNPLSIIRSATRYPTTILVERSVPPVVRDQQAMRFDPDDVYDLTPAKFADLGPDAHDCGIRWGAAKAHLHLQRNRR
jgi:hypothetical protein